MNRLSASSVSETVGLFPDITMMEFYSSKSFDHVGATNINLVDSAVQVCGKKILGVLDADIVLMPLKSGNVFSGLLFSLFRNSFQQVTKTNIFYSDPEEYCGNATISIC